jgi:2-polyprenyl-3-methyl-5-hydroxy-6-metoxy-1,4-benzoquinol methylase
MAINPQKLEAFMGKAVVEMGAAMNAALIVLGDRLGLYKAMAGVGPTTPAAVAAKTSTSERYVQEWMNAQAAGGILEYDAATATYTLPNEHAFALAQEDSPAFIPGAFQIVQSMMIDEPRLSEAFRSGEGVGWDQHPACLFHGTERFFRPGYTANLTTHWIPALDGMEGRLEAGAKVADIGCGHGASTILMAQAYPKSTFFGFDYHEGSIVAARKAAERAGVSARCTFDVASAKAYPGNDYDLVACFDCLHDMGDPEGASAHVFASLKPDGAWMIVEPFAHDDIASNLNPVGRIFYCASTMICTPASKAQEVGLALGAQAGEKRLREVVTAGGFTRFRRATETPFNLILEARP